MRLWLLHSKTDWISQTWQLGNTILMCLWKTFCFYMLAFGEDMNRPWFTGMHIIKINFHSAEISDWWWHTCKPLITVELQNMPFKYSIAYHHNKQHAVKMRILFFIVYLEVQYLLRGLYMSEKLCVLLDVSVCIWIIGFSLTDSALNVFLCLSRTIIWLYRLILFF